MDPPRPASPEKALSTGTSPPNNMAVAPQTQPDANSAPSSRTATATRALATRRIRHGLLSRAGSEAEDRSLRAAESPAAWTSDDDDHPISDSAALPRRFPSASSSRVASIRSVSSRQPSAASITPGPWPIPPDVTRVADARTSPRDPHSSDSSSSLERAKSISSVSSVNSTSSLEAAPFREAPLGNVRVGFRGTGGHRAVPTGDSRLVFTPTAQQQASAAMTAPYLEPSATHTLAEQIAVSPPETRSLSDRHKGVPKAASNSWVYRNAPGMRGSRLRPPSQAEQAAVEEETLDAGQATPGKRTRDALRLKIAKSASKLGLRTGGTHTGTTFGDSGADGPLSGSLQTTRAPSSDEDDTRPGLMSGSRSPMGTRTPFFSTGPHSPHLHSYSGPPSSGTTPTEVLTKTSTVTNASTVVSKLTGDLGRASSRGESCSPLQEVLDGLTRLPAPKVSPRAGLSGSPAPDPFSIDQEAPQSVVARPPLIRADSSSGSQDMPAVPGLALAQNAADVSNSSTLRPPPRSTRRDSQVSGASSEGTAKQVAFSTPSKPSTRSPSDFHFGDTLGEGSYSTVLEGWDLLSGPAPKEPGVIDPYAVTAASAMFGGGPKRRLGHIDLQGRKVYAVKVLDKVHILKQGKQKYVTVEKEALSRLIKLPGVVTLFWTFQDRESLYFVLELATNGELLGFIRKFGSFDSHSARFYAAMLADTIRSMHAAGVVHRDLKPENVLLDADMRIKVTDFGSAKLLDSAAHIQPEPQSNSSHAKNRTGSFVGTAEYVSPELLAETAQPAGKPADWWAFGCVLFQMISGRPPFKGVNEYQTLQKVKHRDFAFPESFPEDARDLIDRLLCLEPDQRPSAAQVLGHPYFASINFDTLWIQSVPPLKTGMTEPLQKTSRLPSRSDESFDQSFISDASLGKDDSGNGVRDSISASGDEGRQRRSNDADDSDLSDGTSDADSDGLVRVSDSAPAPQRRTSGFLTKVRDFFSP